jgi:hypothetical protein
VITSLIWCCPCAIFDATVRFYVEGLYPPGTDPPEATREHVHATL